MRRTESELLGRHGDSFGLDNGRVGADEDEDEGEEDETGQRCTVKCVDSQV